MQLEQNDDYDDLEIILFLSGDMTTKLQILTHFSI